MGDAWATGYWAAQLSEIKEGDAVLMIGAGPNGRKLIVKTSGVNSCNRAETMKLIEEEKIDTMLLITHTYALKDIEEVYRTFENRMDNAINAAIKTEDSSCLTPSLIFPV